MTSPNRTATSLADVVTNFGDAWCKLDTHHRDNLRVLKACSSGQYTGYSLMMTDTDRIAVTGMVMRLFDLWSLASRQQLAFLGLSASNRSALAGYRDGNPISNDRDKIERAGVLLNIHQSLRLLFPDNAHLRSAWIHQPNRAFSCRSPAAIIERHGMMGLYMVRTYLDRQVWE